MQRARNAEVSIGGGVSSQGSGSLHVGLVEGTGGSVGGGSEGYTVTSADKSSELSNLSISSVDSVAESSDGSGSSDDVGLKDGKGILGSCPGGRLGTDI